MSATQSSLCYIIFSKSYIDILFVCYVFPFQNGLNALHLAAKEGHKDLVEELLERGASVDSSTKVHTYQYHYALTNLFPEMNTVHIKRRRQMTGGMVDECEYIVVSVVQYFVNHCVESHSHLNYET